VIRRHIVTLRLGLMAADAATAFLVFVGLSLLRMGPNWTWIWANAEVDGVGAAVAYGVAWPGLLWISGLYRLRTRWSARAQLIDLLRASVLLAFLSFAVLFLLKLPDVSRLFLLVLFPTQVGVTLVSRFVLRRIFASMRSRGYNTRFLLVVGTGAAAVAFADRVERHADLGIRVIGHLGLQSDAGWAGGRPILGTVDEIEGILHNRVVDEIAICLPSSSLELVEPITRLCEEEGKIVRLPLDDVGLPMTGGRLEEFDGIAVMSFVYGPDRALGLVGKRLVDFSVAAVALVALSPVFLAIALWVRAVDGTGVFFRQSRIGLHGRPFRVAKFRTMVHDAEARLIELEELNEIRGHAFKVTNDPRLSRTGRWLRKTSLDELPQLWNVLLGEMSLVGPRPPLPREVAVYDVWHRRRLSMKPGITGLWQVSARREVDFDRWVEIDLDYIDRWSLWLDLKIMLRTIPAVVLQQGR
jgi:exopolysaccharide biosynthesis polyprenyl glycosylphosphotransferase